MSIALSLSKDKIKILLLEGIDKSAEKIFRQAGYTNIEIQAKALTDEELKSKISTAHFVGIRSRTQLNAEVLSHAKKLVAIGCFCIGTNQVDLATAAERGIVVFNAPYSNTRSVAELVLAEIIMLFRGIPKRNAQAHQGVWLKSASGSNEVRGKVLGIVGYGKIGSQLSVLAEALGMEVIFYDVMTKLSMGNAEQVDSLTELLQKSDVVSLHVPQTKSTQEMIGKQQFKQMKTGSFLINAARGNVVVIEDLVEVLASQQLAGAAVDVFPVEPRSNADEFISPLRAFDNVILTPHIGGSTAEAQQNIGFEVAEKLVKYSDNGTTFTAVNFPEVSLPEQHNTHRLLHIHRNVPGILAKINSIFSNLNVNVSAQYLQTMGDIGYVVMDIDKTSSTAVLKQIDEIEGTIRARVLF